VCLDLTEILRIAYKLKSTKNLMMIMMMIMMIMILMMIAVKAMARFI